MTSCDCLKKIQEIAKWPFYKPVVINQDTRKFECPGWAAKLFKETPTGRISSKSAGSLFLNFCPICGMDFRIQEDANADDKG